MRDKSTASDSAGGKGGDGSAGGDSAAGIDATVGGAFFRRAFCLDGRVAVVTGASSGLGAHMAATLARAGCKVALAARRAARLEAVAESIAEVIADAADTGTVANTNASANTNTVANAGTVANANTVANTNAGTNTGANATDTGAAADTGTVAGTGTGTTTAVESNSRLLTVTMDVRERDAVEAAFARIDAHFGRVDILVNNAGVAAPRRFLDMSEAEWQGVVDTDLSAVWRVGQAAARRMVAQDSGGAIINIASMLGVGVQRGQANYGAAKAGVIQLTRSMALELAHHGVRVNALAPGYFATEMNREFLESARGREYVAGLLPGRAGRLHELDGALLLLASDAGGYINGSVLTVDGGALLGGL
ncbi:MAG: SDR family oxidoreductase [Gammaproteobacteria bacterium]|nr:SDR family oxidoreductase [Gammaproteobacteria bacterium]